MYGRQEVKRGLDVVLKGGILVSFVKRTRLRVGGEDEEEGLL